MSVPPIRTNVNIGMQSKGADHDEPSNPDDTPEPTKFVYGDLDGNGSVDASDALQILRIAAKLETPSDNAIQTGDVDGNGSLDAADALLILQKAAKIIDSFPVESKH